MTKRIKKLLIYFLGDMLKRYLPEIGFKIVGSDGVATDDEIDHIIQDFLGEQGAA